MIRAKVQEAETETGPAVVVIAVTDSAIGAVRREVFAGALEDPVPASSEPYESWPVVAAMKATPFALQGTLHQPPRPSQSVIIHH